jgi:hypothetical protein
MASYDPDRADPGLDLARQFYTAHELLMTRAAKEAKTEDRQFEFSGDLFDAWAVGAGHMPKRLSGAVDAVEARGLAHLRTSLRHKINRAARRGHGLPGAIRSRPVLRSGRCCCRSTTCCAGRKKTLTASPGCLT